MSGLEILGVVASIIQVVDVGTKLSVKLCSFYRTVRSTDQSIQNLSSDVSLTCSILKELGKTLEQDDHAKLCSEQALSTANNVLNECNSVFAQIEIAIDKYNQQGGRNSFVRSARRFSLVHNIDLEILKGNLKRLKSTTLLILNVIIYAGQIRQRTTTSELKHQRGLLQSLVEEKSNKNASCQKSNFPIDPPTGSILSCRELDEYHGLIRRILDEIDACQHSLGESRHLRIRNGVANVHAREETLFRYSHGHTVTRLFSKPFFRVKSVDPSDPGATDTFLNSQGKKVHRSVQCDTELSGRAVPKPEPEAETDRYHMPIEAVHPIVVIVAILIQRAINTPPEPIRPLLTQLIPGRNLLGQCPRQEYFADQCPRQEPFPYKIPPQEPFPDYYPTLDPFPDLWELVVGACMVGSLYLLVSNAAYVHTRTSYYAEKNSGYQPEEHKKEGNIEKYSTYDASAVPVDIKNHVTLSSIISQSLKTLHRNGRDAVAQLSNMASRQLVGTEHRRVEYLSVVKRIKSDPSDDKSNSGSPPGLSRDLSLQGSPATFPTVGFTSEDSDIQPPPKPTTRTQWSMSRKGSLYVIETLENRLEALILQWTTLARDELPIVHD